MVQKFVVIGLEPVGSTGEETRDAIATDIPKWGKVIKDAGIRVGP
jgi:tripartite-type tricarboxylate transporter receptor subunit TctC